MTDIYGTCLFIYIFVPTHESQWIQNPAFDISPSQVILRFHPR